ncbi:hypothetical protein DL768_002222 [Monosporascus sp. mg162]|nr:hypothetical protein DL768_002222 [Monosporascus sp. mg162]
MPPVQTLPTSTLSSSHRGLLGMDPDQLDRFTTTESLRFLVGYDTAEVSIRSGLLSRLSAELSAVAHGGTGECLEGASRKYSPSIMQTNLNPGKTALEHMFIRHAKIYIFTHTFAITSLMDLAYSQLAVELTQWIISPSAFASEFGGPVRYVCGNCKDREYQLRRLVAEFAACVVEDVTGLKGG